MCKALGMQEQFEKSIMSKAQVLKSDKLSPDPSQLHLMPAMGLWGIYLNSPRLRAQFPYMQNGTVTLLRHVIRLGNVCQVSEME